MSIDERDDKQINAQKDDQKDAQEDESSRGIAHVPQVR